MSGELFLISIPIIVGFITQTTKFILFSFKNGIKWNYLLTHGHMPSFHSALVSSLALTVGYMDNFQGSAFLISIIISFIFIAITILVVFNAIRIAIYTHKREIRIMKLVGASNWFIRMPFLAEAILYALIGIIGVLIIFYPFLQLLQPYLSTFFSINELNLIGYFINNFFLIFGLQFLGASLINIIASLLAVGKYIKV